MTLTPVGAWQVDFGETQCRLLHEFEGGGGKVLFALTGAGPSPVERTDYYRVYFLFPAHGPKLHLDSGRGHVTLDRDDKKQPRYFSSGTTPDGRPYVLSVIKLPDLADLGRVRHLHVDAGELDADLQLNATPKVMATLLACMDDLQAKWGLDPTERHRVGTPARPLRGVPYPYQDIELSNVKRGSVATLIMSWTIDVHGRATDCQIKLSSGSPRLDQNACRSLETNALYVPARDKAGDPMPVHTFISLGWTGF